MFFRQMPTRQDQTHTDANMDEGRLLHDSVLPRKAPIAKPIATPTPTPTPTQLPIFPDAAPMPAPTAEPTPAPRAKQTPIRWDLSCAMTIFLSSPRSYPSQGITTVAPISPEKPGTPPGCTNDLAPTPPFPGNGERIHPCPTRRYADSREYSGKERGSRYWGFLRYS